MLGMLAMVGLGRRRCLLGKEEPVGFFTVEFFLFAVVSVCCRHWRRMHGDGGDGDEISGVVLRRRWRTSAVSHCKLDKYSTPLAEVSHHSMIYLCTGTIRKKLRNVAPVFSIQRRRGEAWEVAVDQLEILNRQAADAHGLRSRWSCFRTKPIPSITVSCAPGRPCTENIVFRAVKEGRRSSKLPYRPGHTNPSSAPFLHSMGSGPRVTPILICLKWTLLTLY